MAQCVNAPDHTRHNPRARSAPRVSRKCGGFCSFFALLSLRDLRVRECRSVRRNLQDYRRIRDRVVACERVKNCWLSYARRIMLRAGEAFGVPRIGRMTPTKDKSRFVSSRISGSALLAVALTSVLAAASLAQDAGVSGIPPGPANGWNSRNPSFNIPKPPPIPPPTIKPVTPPAVAPLNPTRPQLGQGSNRFPTVRARSSSSRARRTAVRENDRLLDHGVTSICRGC